MRGSFLYTTDYFGLSARNRDRQGLGMPGWSGPVAQTVVLLQPRSSISVSGSGAVRSALGRFGSAFVFLFYLSPHDTPPQI